MSFEGYYQVICQNGHYYETPYDYGFGEDDHLKCHICGADEAWHSIVDVTNGLDENSGVVEVTILEPEQRCVCPLCERDHIAREAIYQIPGRVETRDDMWVLAIDQHDQWRLLPRRNNPIYTALHFIGGKISDFDLVPIVFFDEYINRMSNIMSFEEDEDWKNEMMRIFEIAKRLYDDDIYQEVEHIFKFNN